MLFASGDPITMTLLLSVALFFSILSRQEHTGSGTLEVEESLDVESLHNAIVERLNAFLEYRHIKIPDSWSTLDIIHDFVIDDVNLFTDASFLRSILSDLMVPLSQEPCWVEVAIQAIKLIQYS